MKKATHKIGLGGGCHWCTEAVFLSLRGILKVEQGFIKPEEDTLFSEAVIVTYDASVITLKDLVEIHLHTHKSTSYHSMRNKYRSAIYAFDDYSFEVSNRLLKELQTGFDEKLITQVFRFGAFKSSEERFHNYFYKGADKPFCTTYIAPKLSLLMKKYRKLTDTEKVATSIAPKVTPE